MSVLSLSPNIPVAKFFDTSNDIDSFTKVNSLLVEKCELNSLLEHYSLQFIWMKLQIYLMGKAF